MAANEAEVDLVVNAAGALPDLERQLSAIIREAEQGADEVDVQASLAVQNSIAVMSTQLQRAINDIDRSNPTIDVEAALDTLTSLNNLREDVGELTNRINSGLFDPIELAAELDLGRSLREVTEDLHDLVQDAERTAEAIRLDVEIDEERARRRAERITQALRRVGDGALVAGRGIRTMLTGTAALSLAVGGTTQTVAALAAALQQVAPAAAVGTSAILTQKLALGTLKLALVGVQEGIENVFNQDLTASEFHKSIEGLAPEARLFVDEIHTMRRELRAVQQQVQNRVFRNFDDDLRSLTKTLGPTIQGALNRTADSLNAMGRNAVVAANQIGRQGVLGQALTGATTALERLELVPARAVRSFSFLAAASSPALNRIAGAVDDVSLRIQNKLQRAFESGALERSIDQAVSSIAQLGTVIGNFGGAVSNIFSGLTQDGGGLFDVLEKVSEAFERLTASREFQSILNELSLTAGVLVDNILPLIQEAFVQLGPVIEELAPVVRDFVAAIGPELIPIVEQLGPILVDIALILRDQLPLAIELASAAIDVLSVALTIIKGGMELAKEASQAFADFLNSDFANAMGASSDFAVENSDEILAAITHWTAEGIRLVEDFNSGMADFSANLRDSLLSGFQTLFDDILSNVQTFLGLLSDSFNELPGRMVQVGQDIMSGLAAGLLNGVSNVLGIARGIADSVVSTIESALDIHSPSRRTKKTGVNTVRGLEDGMLERLAKLLAVSRTVADSAASEINKAFGARLGRPNSGFQSATAGASRVIPPTVTGRGTGIVNVYIGGELVRQIVNDQFKSLVDRRDRTLAQGYRI